MRTVVSLRMCLLAATLLSAHTSAQTTVAQEPAFEVVSVKPNRSPESMMTMQNAPSGLVAINMPLSFLLMAAFEVSTENILEAPGWIHTERFDVEGRVGERDRDLYRNKTRATSRAMLRSLLIDRFKLLVREIPQNGRGYSLVVARSDGRLGGQLRSSSLVCEQEQVKCFLEGGAAGELRGRGIPIGRLAGYLGLALGTVVRDNTALMGTYDFELRWTPDQRSPRPFVDAAATPGADEGSLFTAVVEQLGLRLQPTPILQRSIVVDHIERPQAN
jgi:uncharacterized protein (TIGR03435 family)